ncbi:MAG: DMT family transporter [Chlamydiae bacterium]|nr:DMT family transporter [Chlamydiota bacterium]
MPLIVLLYALLASTFVFAKFSLDYAQPIFVIGFRMTLAGALLLGYLVFFKRKSLKLKKSDLFIFLRVAFFHIYLAFVAEFWSLQYITSSKANLIYSLTPFIAAGLSYFLLKERLSKRKLLGIVIGILGIIPILISQGTDFSMLSKAEIVLLIAVVSASYAWFDIKKLMNKGYSLLMINGFSMFVGGIAAFITYYASRDPAVPSTTNFWEFFKYVSLLVVLSNVIFYNLYGWLLKRYTITFLTFCGFLSPLFGVFMGWAFRGEAISWPYWVSLSLITFALFIFYREEIKLKVAAPAGPS